MLLRKDLNLNDVRLDVQGKMGNEGKLLGNGSENSKGKRCLYSPESDVSRADRLCRRSTSPYEVLTVATTPTATLILHAAYLLLTELCSSTLNAA